MSMVGTDITPGLQQAEVPPPEKLIMSALDLKMALINRYDEIIWKVRTGYLAILYTALTFLMGKAGVDRLECVADNMAVSLSIFFLILGFSLSAFSVDFGYLRKKLRVIVIRNMLVDIAYDPECTFKDKLRKLLHVAAERPLKSLAPDAEGTYREKLTWNIVWILLPIYATTPVLALIVYALYRGFFFIPCPKQ